MRLRYLLVPLLVIGLSCAGFDRESGVCLPSQIDDTARGYLEQHALLQPGEEVRAYYDATISLDGSEIQLVTDRRLVHFVGGRATAIDLVDVVSIDRLDDVPAADAWLVTARDGRAMQLEVAMLNGGDTWDRVMNQTWQAAAGGSPSPAP